MADHIHIEDVPPYNGDYDLDLTYFTNREMHTIKRLSGTRAGELSDALLAGDTDLVVALAVVALTRAGVVVVEETLWDAPVGKITYVGDEEDEERPPDEPLAS